MLPLYCIEKNTSILFITINLVISNHIHQKTWLHLKIHSIKMPGRKQCSKIPKTPPPSSNFLNPSPTSLFLTHQLPQRLKKHTNMMFPLIDILDLQLLIPKSHQILNRHLRTSNTILNRKHRILLNLHKLP